MRKKKAVNFRPQVDMNIGDKYLLKEFIDEGSFGYVWRSVNLESKEIVALKIPKDQERGDNTLSEGKEFIGNHHPNVITIYWMGRVDGVFLIEMEYFNGHKLSDELCETGFMSPRTFEEIYSMFFQILDGIEYIHSKNICHGDIKPQNILTDGTTVKITDFGTSKLIEDLFIKTIDGGGTWAYMAPEVAGSNRRYLNSDIYGLGVLLYKFLTGRTPHETANQLINNMPYPRPREINDNIPESVEKIIMKLLERTPEGRYQNVQDIKRDFKEVLKNENNSIISYSEGPEVIRYEGSDWLERVIRCYKNKKDFIDKSELWEEEERTGIGIEKSTRTSKQGMLYFTSHIRPKPELSIVVKVRGINEKWHQKVPSALPLGGEGRMATVKICDDKNIIPPMPELKVDAGKIRFTVILITPGCILPSETIRNPVKDMEDLIKKGYPSIPGSCISACIGKLKQIGGFDIKKREPRPLIPIIPAGSMWFYEGDAKGIDTLKNLHGKVSNPLGFNQIIIGNWRGNYES
jgi:CRISPR type III-B/RAMP module-associated protein Cmr3